MLTRALTLFIGLTALPSFTACEVAQAGEEGRLSFRLDAAEGVVPATFSTPLAVGYDVDVLVHAVGAVAGTPGEAVAISGAVSDDPAIVSVTGTGHGRVSLRALSAGPAHVRVDSAVGEDGFSVTAADVAGVELKAPGVLVPDNPPSAIVEGGTARVFAALKDGAGRTLAGRGALPVTVSPSEAGEVLEAAEVGFLRVRADAVGALTLTPVGGDPLELDVVAATDVTALELRGANITELKVGAVLSTAFRGTTDDMRVVVGLGEAGAVTGTADICTVKPLPRLGEGVFEVKGVAEGSCTLTATFGTLEKTATFEVVP